jgi:hypothetical protein
MAKKTGLLFLWPERPLRKRLENKSVIDALIKWKCFWNEVGNVYKINW